MTEVATVLPNELRLGAPPTMPQARSYMFRQQSTLQTYSAGNQIQINIPRLQRSYLRKDSYLRFAVDITETTKSTNGSAGHLTFDTAGAYSLIQKIEIFDYLGSTVLESISEVPQLMALLLDMGLPDIDSTTNGATSLGLEAGYSHPINPRGGAANSVTTETVSGQVTQDMIWKGGSRVRAPQSGITLVPYKTVGTTPQTLNAVNNYNAEFSIPLPSFLGFLSKKMVPLHNGFTILITLVPTVETAVFQPTFINHEPILALEDGTLTAVKSTNTFTGALPAIASASTYSMSVSEVFMECQILELGPVAESMILSSTGGQPLVVHTKSFRSYVGNVNGKAQEFILNLNLNVASLTNILWFMRPSKQTSSIYHQSIGHRTRNMLQRWFFQYGSTTLPQNNGIQTMGATYPSTLTDAIDKYSFMQRNFTEGFNELMKARKCDPSHSRINWDSYGSELKFGAAVQTTLTDVLAFYLNQVRYIYPSPEMQWWLGKFAAGLNLELANGKSGDLISGLNTNGMNTSIRGVFHPLFIDYMDVDGVRVDAYAEYDAFVNISPGIATTVSF